MGRWYLRQSIKIKTRMSRLKFAVRIIAVAMLVLMVLMFIPSVRNFLAQGYLPLLWRDVPTSQILKMKMSTLRSCRAALAPCTQAAHASHDATGRHDRLQQLVSEPFGKIRPRPQDEAAYSKASTWLNQSPERRQRYSHFLPVLTLVQKAHLVRTWEILHEALTLHNISHYLIAGTLMGALRHRGIIPWDDDMDIAVDEKDILKVQRALSCIPGYTLHMLTCMHWKFFADDAQVIASDSEAKIFHPRKLSEKEKKEYVTEWHSEHDVARRAPFLDVFLMTGDNTYTWCWNHFNTRNCLFRREDVYPLAQVKFEGYLAPVPRRSTSIVTRNYNANMCTSPKSNHVAGTEIKDISVVPCRELAEMHTVNYVV